MKPFKDSKHTKAGARFYIDQAISDDTAVIDLPKEITKHALSSLRLKEGNLFHIFNGKGGEYLSKLILPPNGNAKAEIIAYETPNTESSLDICLVQSYLSNEKMNFLIQKATELGINEINIFKSERSSFKVDKDQLNKKKAHWNKVAIAACEQSGRTRIPKIETFQSLESLISGPSASEPTEAKLILCPKGSKTIEIITRPPERVVIAVGPEGGFTKQEVASAISYGFSDVRLGPRTLRTETAGISLIAGIQTLWGDF